MEAASPQLVQPQPVMSSKKQRSLSTSDETDSFLEWAQHRLLLSAKVLLMNVAYNQLQNCLVQRQPIQLIMEPDSMSSMSQQPLTTLWARWKTNGDWTVTQLPRTRSSIHTKPTPLLVVEAHKARSKHFDRPSEKVRIRWSLPTPKDSPDTLWVLELKMRACSMAC